MSGSKIGLSTTAVYPEATASAFEVAAFLGFDGVELMVAVDPISQDIDAIEKLSQYHQVPVLSVHAPVLLVSQATWGTDPWDKLRRSAEAATRLGADVVVVHPPFRWQRSYGAAFVEGIRRLNEETEVTFAVENMFPWRSAGRAFQAYIPHHDPTDYAYDHLTLDLSHAATAGMQSLDLVHAWGDRLHHIHLTDGTPSFKDDHLMPGEGNQQAWEVVEELGRRGFEGHIVLEVVTRKLTSRDQREAVLAESLSDTRRFYARGAAQRNR